MRTQNKHLTHDSDSQRKRSTKHGYYYEPWYRNYRTMMGRCYCKKTGNYHQYGAVGVTVCKEWHDINNFKKWVDESGFRPGLTLDRIDNTKGYSPENCRWATMKEQTNNRRNTIFLTYKGRKMALTEWSDEIGINPSTLRCRITRQGRSVERAIEELPKRKNKKRNCGVKMDGGQHETD